MQTTLLLLTQSVGQFFMDLFCGLFIEPAKTLYHITMEYMVQTNLDPVAFTGLIIAYLLIANAVRAAYLLGKFIIQYIAFRYREKRKAELRAERKKAEAKLRARIAYDQEFEELYQKYAV